MDNLIGRAAKVTFQVMRYNQDAPLSKHVNELKPEKVLDSCLSALTPKGVFETGYKGTYSPSWK